MIWWLVGAGVLVYLLGVFAWMRMAAKADLRSARVFGPLDPWVAEVNEYVRVLPSIYDWQARGDFDE